MVSVSVVVPAYNRGEGIAETIESIYAQTRLPDEVIVVDDGSTDDTPEVIRRFDERPGFRSIRKPNGGEASARNAGVELAGGDYVAFLDHDDLWKPEKLERQLATFDPSWSMSFTWLEYETTAGVAPTTYFRYESWDPEPGAVLSRLERWCAVGPPSTVLVRRDALLRIAPFERVRPFGDDWLMWLRFARAGYLIGYLPEPLAVYRWHGGNLSIDDRGQSFDAACAVFDRYGDPRLRVWRRLLAAIYAHEHGDRPRARRRLAEAARIRPWSIRPGWLRLLV